MKQIETKQKNDMTNVDNICTLGEKLSMFQIVSISWNEATQLASF